MGTLGLGTLPELPELWNQGPGRETISMRASYCRQPGAFNQAAFKRSHFVCDFAGCLHHL